MRRHVLIGDNVRVTRRLDAVYENGVLRPLEPLLLKERQRVRVTVSDEASPTLKARVDRDFLEALRKSRPAGAPKPSLTEVRRALSGLGGSLADDIRSEREAG